MSSNVNNHVHVYNKFIDFYKNYIKNQTNSGYKQWEIFF